MKSVINRKSTIVISPQFTDAIGVFNVHNMHKDNPGIKGHIIVKDAGEKLTTLPIEC